MIECKIEYRTETRNPSGWCYTHMKLETECLKVENTALKAEVEKLQMRIFAIEKGAVVALKQSEQELAALQKRLEAAAKIIECLKLISEHAHMPSHTGPEDCTACVIMQDFQTALAAYDALKGEEK